MLSPNFQPTEALVRQNRNRCAILGRLMAARNELCKVGEQKALKIVNGTIREVQALNNATAKQLQSLNRTGPTPVDHMVLMEALRPGREIPLIIAFHLLSDANLPALKTSDGSLLRKCRYACRDACIKANLGDPMS